MNIFKIAFRKSFPDMISEDYSLNLDTKMITSFNNNQRLSKQNNKNHN